MISSCPDPEHKDPRRLLDRLHQAEIDLALCGQLLDTITKDSGAVAWASDAQRHILSVRGVRSQSSGLPALAQIFGLTGDPAADFPPLLATREALRGKPADFDLRAAGTRWHGHIDPVWGSSGSVIGTAGIASPLAPSTGRSGVEPELHDRESRQSAIAAFGRHALEGNSIQSLMDEAVQLTVRVLGVEFAKILEQQPGSDSLLLAAGAGWRQGLVGTVTIDARSGSQGGYALQAREPVIVDDLASETRFRGSRLLLGHGVVSGVTVLIPGRKEPFGILGAHSAQRHRFTTEDLHFLEAIAHILSAAIERKRSEKELQTQARELEHSNAELRQFAYVASHDLQEPLRTIASFTQFLARRYRGRLDAEADEFIRYIVGAVTRMSNLINDLLDYSRLANPKPEIFTRVDTGREVSAALDNLRQAIGESHAEIKVAANLPSLPADPVRLIRLFQNLISNAIKYHSERPLEIHIDAAPEGSFWRFAISDNGIGIDPRYFERIFGVFKRLHGSEYPGTGIGLAVCRKIVEIHGGRIWVESEPGRGSTFFFTLPK